MVQSKRETLKFIRIRVRPAHLTGDSDPKTISGYLNTYAEFKRWDIEHQQGFIALTSNQRADFGYDLLSAPQFSPKTVFVGRATKERPPLNVGSPTLFKLDESAYRSLAFVIDGVHEPFDRKKVDHSLFRNRSRVFIQESDGRFKNFNNEFVASEDPDLNFLSLLFRVNPTTISIQKKKLFQKLRTRAGWAFQHWGPEIGQISLKGTTGSMLLDPDIKLATKNLPLIGDVPLLSTLNDERPTPENSPALKAFKELEKWYDEDQSEFAVSRGILTALEWRGRIYVGHLSNFQIDEQADQPFQLFYSLTFIVHYDTNHLQGAVTRASNQIVRNAKTLAQVRSLKGANS